MNNPSKWKRKNQKTTRHWMTLKSLIWVWPLIKINLVQIFNKVTFWRIFYRVFQKTTQLTCQVLPQRVTFMYWLHDCLCQQVAVCLAGVLLEKLTVTYMYWLTDYLSSSWVSDWSNSGLTDSDLHVLIDWLPRAIAECVTDVILD